MWMGLLDGDGDRSAALRPEQGLGARPVALAALCSLSAERRLVGSLVIVFGYRPRHWTPLWWLLIGNLLYYAAAIPMAILLKDNRAFCKYLCPVAVLMKLGSRFSPLKIGGVRERCDSCMACVKMCPMDIRIPDYIQAGERVLSTECILCQTCASVCPTSALSVTWGFDVGGKERLEQRP